MSHNTRRRRDLEAQQFSDDSEDEARGDEDNKSANPEWLKKAIRQQQGGGSKRKDGREEKGDAEMARAKRRAIRMGEDPDDSKDNIPETEGIDNEDPEMAVDDGIVLEPFNMRRENEEGHFDESGFYVQSRSEQAENLDAWLDSVDKGDQDSTYQNEEQRKKAEKLHAEFWGQGDDVDEDTQEVIPPLRDLVTQMYTITMDVKQSTPRGALRVLSPTVSAETKKKKDDAEARESHSRKKPRWQQKQSNTEDPCQGMSVDEKKAKFDELSTILEQLQDHYDRDCLDATLQDIYNTILALAQSGAPSASTGDGSAISSKDA
ncbi:CD2 antigen cytoplasmic tail-binding protein, putative [Perkinsus marinus ATCC 50983]|uniref:CD2 antigen cytoplasmic tail-binding protein, putative n=1 Tax=Perkinsus marinus (strain ATCC 50983 / TXsc) TaxID=423536 RepID=C5LL29_PERM5|nr:CD2 antigen cytoplasmic tail-binding protein, putative [Perkinsus marinus ATCC 50983]EER02593.1 CD2 antigen cytoplasmic tail-binding protein, putative [Perkinsus marinus ATCC 50983]|eukprot:XP_002769875.1 CD2 antigen cytoplasmic tail-binding protein, putative [Perkinsus marinus ATCC 50983]